MNHFEKRKIQEYFDSRKKQKVIAVWGLSSGCGVTYLSLVLAQYFQQVKGLRVAYLEMNLSNQITNLSRRNCGRGTYFTYYGTHCYAHASKEEMLMTMNSEYDVVILDLGTRGERLPKEFQVCQVRLIVAHGAFWQVQRIEDWLEKQEENEARNQRYLLPFAEKRTIQVLKKRFPYEFYGVPYQAEIEHLNPCMISTICNFIS